MRTLAIAASTFAFAALSSLSLTTTKAEAQARIVVHPGYAASSVYFDAADLPWYAVRAYYHGRTVERRPLHLCELAGLCDPQRHRLRARLGDQGQDGIMYRCQ